MWPEDHSENRRDQSLGEVELLFEQVRDQAEESYEAAGCRADDVKVDYGECRHGFGFLASKPVWCTPRG
jgi:hypothetical protein